MAPRPKYRAVRSFSVNGVHFDAGDEVPAGAPLSVALTHGDTFVRVDTARSRKQADNESTEPTED